MNELSITYFNAQTKEADPIDSLRFEALWKESSGFFWIDINNPDITALSEFLSSMGIPCVWTDHFTSPEILPHLHDTTTAISFYLYDIQNAESLGDTSKDLHEFVHVPLLVILATRFVITYHHESIDLINYIKRDYISNFKLAGKTPGFLAFLLFQHALYNYARLNLMNDNFLDDLEFGLITGNPSDNIPRISTAGYNILTLKKLNANLHIILLMLVSKKSYCISEEARQAFEIILDETISIRASVDSSRDLLDSIIGSIDAEASRKTSEIIRVLTITSCIFMPLTLITGIYGMNFHLIPGLDWDYGFYAAITGMLGLAAGFLYLLRRLGWLGEVRNSIREQDKKTSD